MAENQDRMPQPEIIVNEPEFKEERDPELQESSAHDDQPTSQDFSLETNLKWLEKIVRKNLPRLDDFVYDKFLEEESGKTIRSLREAKRDEIVVIALCTSWIANSDKRDIVGGSDSAVREEEGKRKEEEEEDMEGMEVSQEVIARVKKKKKKNKKKVPGKISNASKTAAEYSSGSNRGSIAGTTHLAPLPLEPEKSDGKKEQSSTKLKNFHDLIAEVAEMEKRDLGIITEINDPKQEFEKVLELQCFHHADMINSKVEKYSFFLWKSKEMDSERKDLATYVGRNSCIGIIDKPWIGSLTPRIISNIFGTDDPEELRLFKKMTLCKLNNSRRISNPTEELELEADLDASDPLAALVCDAVSAALVESETEVRVFIPEELEPLVSGLGEMGEGEKRVLEEVLVQWNSSVAAFWGRTLKESPHKLRSFSQLLKKRLGTYAIVCALYEETETSFELWNVLNKGESQDELRKMTQGFRDDAESQLRDCQELCSLYLLPKGNNEENEFKERAISQIKKRAIQSIYHNQAVLPQINFLLFSRGIKRGHIKLVDRLESLLEMAMPRIGFILSSHAFNLPSPTNLPNSLRVLLQLFSSDLVHLVSRNFTIQFCSGSIFSRPTEAKEVLEELAGVIMRFRRRTARIGACLFADFDEAEVQRSLGLVEYTAGVVQSLSDLFQRLSVLSVVLYAEVWDSLEDRSILDSAETTLQDVKIGFQKVEFDVCKISNRGLFAELMTSQENYISTLQAQILEFLHSTAKVDPGVVATDLTNFTENLRMDYPDDVKINEALHNALVARNSS